ncbi:MAG: hypothetical protein NTY07_00145 [Bacteroidia bacterium]|nr:hypothetical protein [Bacteroidia bacterium]
MKILFWLLFFGMIFFSGCNGQSGRKKPLISPPTIITTDETTPIPIYNIYIENSGSMDGYVEGVTEFEQAVYNFLVDIQNNNLTDSLNLNYINSIIIPNRPDVADFIAKLEPATFRQRGGNIASTDISQMFGAILKETNNNCVSVFISDCVFSPGNGQDAQQYLINQQIGIKRNFALKLDHNNLSTVVLQLSSKFNGKYFNRLNQPFQISAQRPYYIWLIGKHEFLTNLFDKISKASFKGGGVQNFYCAYNSEKSFDYGILNFPKLGTYERDKNSPKNKIINAIKSDKGMHIGEFQFSVGINFKYSLFDNDYIIDENNYKVPDNYTIEVVKNNIVNSNYTHIIKLTTKSLKTENVNIKLKNKLPQWVTNINSDDDTNINAKGELNKTFGIKYLIEGIYEAYKTKNNNKETFFEINISVNQ